MKELIWFTIPGGIAAFAWWLIFPHGFESDNAPFFAAAASFGFGYMLNQIVRCIWEQWFGYNHKRRTVLNKIKQAYDLKEEGSHENKAFDIWHSAFYSDCIPESFREHNSGTWHYLIAFLTVQWAWILGAFALMAAQCLSSHKGDGRCLCGGVILFLVMAVIIWWKRDLTLRALDRQEEACFKRYRSVFNKAKEEIMKNGEESKHKQSGN
ncbi:hypothetical protein [Prosthecobacter sp.]|uniref:hypothetical protein n=1 Tax=Prosthecobacter sp. TaxID=1965333 RepID=UPI002ABB8602|nr:hypothetical protein [Prosthecobacter sp.]MDZ4403369.1 hypothetical protein [Prosthecobacter sp.]